MSWREMVVARLKSGQPNSTDERIIRTLEDENLAPWDIAREYGVDLDYVYLIIRNRSTLS